MSEEIKTAPTQDTAISDNALSSAINRIMEHPELISMVASALGGSVGSNANDNGGESKEGGKEADSNGGAEEALPVLAKNSEALSALAPTLEKLRGLNADGNGEKSGNRHERLLCALKPYLCDSRQEAVDFILKISQLSGLMGLLR